MQIYILWHNSMLSLNTQKNYKLCSLCLETIIFAQTKLITTEHKYRWKRHLFYQLIRKLSVFLIIFLALINVLSNLTYKTPSQRIEKYIIEISLNKYEKQH